MYDSERLTTTLQLIEGLLERVKIEELPTDINIRLQAVEEDLKVKKADLLVWLAQALGSTANAVISGDGIVSMEIYPNVKLYDQSQTYAKQGLISGEAMFSGFGTVADVLIAELEKRVASSQSETETILKIRDKVAKLNSSLNPSS